MMRITVFSIRFLAAALALVALVGCERPPVESQQTGYRGTGMADIQNPRDAKSTDAYPADLEPLPAAGPKAGEVYENVQVLGHLTVPEFTRLMTAMTSWVSPEEGCNYCHVVENLASDDIYTKVVSRRMIQMNQSINREWSKHVGANGVNCYTCHRGKAVPEYIWFETPAVESAMATFAGNRAGQNAPAPEVGLASLPVDPLSTFLEAGDTANIRVIPRGIFPGDTPGASIQMTEQTYALMMHLSSALDANCTYCHNTASFQNWAGSTPQRTTAYHGIEMVRSLNGEYLVPLGGTFPATRLGPLGDAPKLNCATCHQGQKKPLGGAPAVAAYPTLAAE